MWGTIPNGDGMPAYPVCAYATVQQAPIAFPSIADPWALSDTKLDAMALSWSTATIGSLQNLGCTWQANVGATPAKTVKFNDDR